MNEIDIAKIDLNLLKSLKVLLDEKHVGRAAERMFITQSAMSYSLARLRKTFNDPLFVRTGHGMEPTKRALEISSKLNSVLFDISQILTTAEFDPAHSNNRFRIQTHDFITATYLHKVVKSVKHQAQGVTFDVNQITTSCYQQLDNAEIDIIIGAGLQANAKLMQRSLAVEKLVCLMDRKHPALNNLTVKNLFDFEHIKLTRLDDRDDPISNYVKKNNLPARKIGVYTETLQMQIEMLKDTQMIAFVPESVAKQGMKYFGLEYIECPVPTPPLSIKAIWHERNQNDPSHKWIRTVIASCFGAA